MTFLKRLFMPAQPVPAHYRRNFFHLYLDIAWWGLLNGSILVFLSVYASRLGATTFQVGLLTAIPALMNLMFTLPAGNHLRRWHIAKATRWSALINRLFYLLLIPLPVILPADTQVWVILAITLLMNIPGTWTSIAFNAFFAEAVPPEWRGQVAGIRNAIFSLTTMFTALIVGVVLDRSAFETGYQIVFGIGVAGAMMSVVHLWMVRLPEKPAPTTLVKEVQSELQAAEKAPLWASRLQALRLDVLRGSFGRLLILIFIYQVGVFLIGPVVPKYQVDVLVLSDVTISQGSALFWITHFIGSVQSQRLSSRWGFRRMTGWGLVIVSVTLVMFTYSYNIWVYLLHALIGGLGWAWIASGLVNLVLERIPADDRPSHLAWFNLVNNAAALICGLVAPLVAAAIGMAATLLVAAGIRLGVGVALTLTRPHKAARGRAATE
ncbi:MAG: MFS transporter [Chloroflexota bacterium]|jgi:MFS family permease